MEMTLTDFGTLIIAIGTIGSLLYIARQANISQQQSKGQFLIALDNQIERSIPTTMKIINNPDFKPEGLEWPEVWRLMSVFERMNIMVDSKILDIGIVDRLYGFQVVGIIANDEIYHRLKKTGTEWQDFIDLCHALAHQRRRSTHEIDKAFIERVSHLSKETRMLRNPFGYQNTQGQNNDGT